MWYRSLLDSYAVISDAYGWLIAPQFVKPYVQCKKHDATAICEAASQLAIRFSAVKAVQSQAVLALHRVRDGFIKARTAQAN